MERPILLYLVSHASGELVEMLARNAVAQLADVSVERHLWKFVRDLGQLPSILATIAARPGFTFHSVSDQDVRSALEEGCSHLRTPCQFVLEPAVSRLAEHYGTDVRFRSTAREPLDEDYYTRVEAMKFTLAHDDGVASDNLEGAEVILVGVSRSTKTPTCMYLASRGVKAANVPLVPGVPLPEGVERAQATLVVGLTVDPSRLSRVRHDRLAALHEEGAETYADLDSVREEVRDAKRLFMRHGWPVIDVSHRSIEQTASMIIALLEKKRATAAAG